MNRLTISTSDLLRYTTVPYQTIWLYRIKFYLKIFYLLIFQYTFLFFNIFFLGSISLSFSTCFLCIISFYSLILTSKPKTSNISGRGSRPFEYRELKKRMPFGSSASLTSCMILSKQYTISAVYRNVFPLKFHWKILNYMHHKITRCAVSR